MKVLTISTMYPPHYLGGYEVSCKAQVDELTRRGHQIHVLTSRWRAGSGKIEGRVLRLLDYAPELMGLKKAQPGRDPLRVARRFRQLKWALSCRRNYRITRSLVRELRPDIVYAWQMGGISVSPLLAAQDDGIVPVLNLGDYWLAELKSRLRDEGDSIKRWYRRNLIGIGNFDDLDIRHLLVNSHYLKKSYATAGVPERNITVIPRGIPSELVLSQTDLQATSREDGVKLIFAGRLVPQKGVDLAIQAVGLLQAEPLGQAITLDIAGTGPEAYVEQLRDLARQLGIAGRVRFLGGIDRQELLERYVQYDAMLFPVRWEEPFGVAVIEAMARGLTVIASRMGGIPELITDGETGLLVPPENAPAVASAIEKIVVDTDLTRRLRSAALKKVQESHDQERVLDETERYLEAVAGKAELVAA